MKIGFCAKPERLEEIRDAGFDYIELPVNYVAALSGEEFDRLAEKVREGALPCPAFNLLFPGTMKLLDGSCTEQEIRDYLDGALKRVSALGGRVVVFGSGKSRARPEGMGYDEAFRALARVCVLCGEAAEKYGLTVVIEPLNRGECNMINSVAEGACLRAAANHPRVQLLADYYHIAMEGEPPADLARLGGIAHCHIAALAGRRIPLEAEEGFRTLFSAMKKTGYEGLLSVEGKCENLKNEGPEALRLLRRLWAES